MAGSHTRRFFRYRPDPTDLDLIIVASKNSLVAGQTSRNGMQVSKEPGRLTEPPK
jgi:hypothetical protein